MPVEKNNKTSEADPGDVIKSTPDVSSDGAGRSGDGLLVVGIGASAGGIAALKSFFENVPQNSGIAYVVVLHVSPDHESSLAQVLQVVSKIPVEQVNGTVKVEPDRVYVISPKHSLCMLDGHLQATPFLAAEGRRAPIDMFFRTLAESHHDRAVCVILSGTGSDGSMGLKRVKELGGAAFVQNPREAEFNEMPRSSIATDLIDSIMPVAEIPAKIAAYKRGLATAQISVEVGTTSVKQHKDLREIFTQLRVRTGHDFSSYKQATMLRRIERRMSVHNLSGLTEYTVLLRKHPEECVALLKDLLISVTNFFRDAAAFEGLKREIFPRILNAAAPNDPVRIWSVGCATGEEAYSLAIIIAELLADKTDVPNVQIFATDIDETALSTAREGFYSATDTADVSPEQLRRFFTEEGGGYRVRRELREMILFANHNILKDPPFARLDLATCRNLLIYLNQNAQTRVLKTLHFALNAGGFLFIGPSESIDTVTDLYAPVSREHRVYQSRHETARSAFPMPDLDRNAQAKTPERPENSQSDLEQTSLERLSFGDLHQRLLEQYAPPSVVVNEQYDILHLSVRAGKYLQLTGGNATLNLLKVVRPELRLELRSALFEATQRRSSVEARDLTVELNGHSETINIHVRPVLSETDTARGFLLVLFIPADVPREKVEQLHRSDGPMARRLEDELERMKQRLRSASEQFEVQAEELKAYNEELQSMNEELRSSAEELETSKEELQSVNEELITVNQELKIKIEELNQTNSDFRNLINSTDIRTIFLDRELRVNHYSPQARDLFNLLESDIGRPLSDLHSRLDYSDFRADAEKVLKSTDMVERDVRSHDGKTFLMQITPYRLWDDRINGVVIAFFDISKRVEAEDALRKAHHEVTEILETMSDAFYTVDRNWDLTYVNGHAERFLGRSRDELIGRSIWDVFPQSEEGELFEKLHISADEGGDQTFEVFSARLGCWMEVSINWADAGVYVYIRDISDRKRREANIAFLADINGDLAVD